MDKSGNSVLFADPIVFLFFVFFNDCDCFENTSWVVLVLKQTAVGF